MSSTWNSNSNILKKCFQLLPARERNKLIWITAAQMILGLLDLFGVAAIGVLGALSVSGLESHHPGNTVSKVMRILRISNLSFQYQAIVLAAIATFLLITKTICSIYLTKKTLTLLSQRSASMSSTLVHKILTRKFSQMDYRSTANIQFALSGGVEIIFLKIVATIATMIADLSLLLLIGVGLLILDVSTALATFALFSGIGFILYKYMNVRAQDLGSKSAQLEIRTNETLSEMVNGYREITSRNREAYYFNLFNALRFQLAEVNVGINFQPLLSKYVVEAAVVIGAVLVAGMQFALKDATHAIGSLTIFMAAGTRVAPAFLRIQQSAVQVRGNIGSAWPTLSLLDELKPVVKQDFRNLPLNMEYPGFLPSIEFKNVSFNYRNAESLATNNVSFRIDPGNFVAIVGPSGSGKSTIADLILGILEPTSGSIEVSGLMPSACLAKWPGSVGYVPQNVLVVSGSIYRNIALGFEDDAMAANSVSEALSAAKLTDLIESLPNGVEAQIEENGKNLSGGQRQRLGIARALFTKPKLLILDEATSALDGKTEAEISETIQGLHGKVTLLIIAHRLSTVRSADKVIYLEKGKVLAMGTFDEVRSRVPNFDMQASLMGF